MENGRWKMEDVYESNVFKVTELFKFAVIQNIFYKLRVKTDMLFDIK